MIKVEGQELHLASLPRLPQAVQEMLDHFVNLREWTGAHSRLAIQSVSYQPSSREEAKALRLLLEERLQDREARGSGLCPIRQQLYSQVFDEVIRQVALDCPERGGLLMRVRDVLNMTKADYRFLYQSNCEFTQRKCDQQANLLSGYQSALSSLQERKTALQQRYEVLRRRLQLQKRINNERHKKEQELRASEDDYLSLEHQLLGDIVSQIKATRAKK